MKQTTSVTLNLTKHQLNELKMAIGLRRVELCERRLNGEMNLQMAVVFDEELRDIEAQLDN